MTSYNLWGQKKKKVLRLQLSRHNDIHLLYVRQNVCVVTLAILHIRLFKLIVPPGRESNTVVLMQAFERSFLCPTEWAELHGSSLTCFAWHSHRMQLFLSSHSLTPDLTQAGTQYPCASGRKREWVDFPAFYSLWGNKILPLHALHTRA